VNVAYFDLLESVTSQFEGWAHAEPGGMLQSIPIVVGRDSSEQRLKSAARVLVVISI